MSSPTSAHSLFEFGLRQMAECGKALRDIGSRERDMEGYANRAALYFHENLVDGAGQPACACVRFVIAPVLSGSELTPGRHFANMLKRAGLEDLELRSLNAITAPEAEPQLYELMHSADVDGEVAARDGLNFSEIRSVLGLGCRLPSGNLFALVLFGKIAIDAPTAELFRTIALNLRLAALRFDRQTILASGEIL